MRDDRLDILKAWGIIFVVSGHAQSPFGQWIYTFHMPLFFFVSGFLRYGVKEKKWNIFLLKKLKTVIFPYIGFWFISVIVYNNLYWIYYNHCFASIGLNEIKGLILGGRWLADYSNNFPLWYLQLYFIAAIFFELIIRYCNKWLKIIVLIILVFVTIPIQSLLPGRPVFHINVLPAALTFMYLGYGFKYLIENTKIMDDFESKLSIAVLALVIGYMVSSIDYGNIAQINGYHYFIGAFFTIVGFYILSGKFTNVGFLKSLGKNSLFILGLHTLALQMFQGVANYITMGIGITNVLVSHIVLVTIVLVTTYGVTEIYHRLRISILLLFKNNEVLKN